MLEALAGDVHAENDSNQSDQSFFHAGKLKPFSLIVTTYFADDLSRSICPR